MNAKESNRDFRIRVAFWVLGAVLGFLQAWPSRFDAEDNTVSYLDMGSYFFHGHHWAIVNGFWNPVYAFLLGLTVAVTKPSLYWEYPTVHLLVFIVFLFTMTCFDYFLRQWMQLRPDLGPEEKASSEPDWAWISIAYTIFLWSCLEWIHVDSAAQDLLVAGFFYLSCGLLVTISSGRAKWGAFLGLGLTLGLNYLTKFFLLPICLLILVTAWLAARGKARYVVISAIAFVALAAPFIAALSVQKGRLTYGEAATYDYAVNVNRIQRYNWQGDAQMPLAHPTRQIFPSPATFEFREPFKGTYPVLYDLTYWYEGVKPRFHFRQQIKALASNLLWLSETLFFALNGLLLGSVFLVLYGTGRGWSVLSDMLRFWFLLVPCVATTALYAFVFYAPQYLAAAFVVLLLCLFLSAAFNRDLPKYRLVSGVAILQLAMFVALVGLPVTLHVFGIHPFYSRKAEKASYQQVAEKAIEMGLKPGDQIASLEHSTLGMSQWAHLARIEIIAEVSYRAGEEGDANNFWNADPLTQERVIQKLSQTGARAVISQDAPIGAGAGRWLEIGTTGYYLYWLTPAPNDSLRGELAR